MKYAEFAEKIVKEYERRFPHSWCRVRLFSGIGYAIFIDCYLAGNEHEFINGIAQNDMFSIGFYISLPENFNKSDELPEKLVIESAGNCYRIVPDNNYMCYGMRKISFRKTTGTPEKVISVCCRQFDKLLRTVKEDRASGKIHDNFKILLAEKLAGTK